MMCIPRTQSILRILAGFLILSLPSAAAATNVGDVIGLFGGLMRAAIIESGRTEWRKVRPAELACIEDQLQRQGASPEILAQQGIFPNDGRVAGIRALCARAAALPIQVAIPPVSQPTTPTTSQTPTSQNLSLQPSFDCTGVKSALGSILCANQAGATADWEVDTAFKAVKYSLPESARDAFSRSHDDWIQKVDQRCRLPRRVSTYSLQQRLCALNAYAARANSYRSRLNGDALAETRLSPEQRAELQTRLIALGLLHGEADGQFGSDTRSAIWSYQEQIGEPPTEFFSAAQRIRLAEGPALPPGPGPGPQPPPDDSPELRASNEKRCQSEDANDRLAACTAIIDDQGKGYKVALADAYDGRCRSYNDQHMYDRAVQDCKAAIARNSRNKYAYNHLGAALKGQGDVQSALAAYSTSINLDPNWIYSHLARGHIYADMGEKDKAKIDFDKVLSVDPSNQQAKDVLGLLQVELANIDGCASIFG